MPATFRQQLRRYSASLAGMARSYGLNLMAVMLLRGNADSNASALRDAERLGRHSHAGAWERWGGNLLRVALANLVSKNNNFKK